MLYALALTAHSYVRWALLLVASAVLIACLLGHRANRPWTGAHDRLASVFIGLVDLQLLLGIVLALWLSPLPRAAFSGGMGSPVLLFFGLLHPLAMMVGLIVAHAGRARSRALAESRARFRALGLGTMGFLVLALLAFPWPWLAWGRPLVRAIGATDG